MSNLQLFAITDPSRMADIRMRRRRAVFLLAAIVLVPCWWFSGNDRHAGSGLHGLVPAVHVDADIDGTVSRAMSSVAAALGQIDFAELGHSHDRIEPPHGLSPQVVAAGALSIEHHCDGKLTIMPGGGGGELRIYAGHPIGGLQGAAGRTVSPDICSVDGDVFIQMPSDMPISINAAGDGDVVLGRFTSLVTLRASGSSDVAIAASTGPLDATREGSGDLTLGVVGGPAQITKGGSGNLKLGDLRAPAHIDAEGSGDLSLGVVGAPLELAQQGSGNVTLGTLSAPGRFTVGGSSDLRLGLVHTDQLGVRMGGSGSLRIGAGTIGMLDVRLEGTVDGEINAQVSNSRQQVGREASLSFSRSAGNTTLAPLPPLPPIPPVPPLPPGG